MITGAPGIAWLTAYKTEIGQIELINEDVHHPNRAILMHPVIQLLGKQCTLAPVDTLDIPLHESPSTHVKGYHVRRFHTAWTRSGRR